MRAALPPTRATSEVSCERTGVCNPLRISAPGAVIAKDGWTLWKDGGAVSRWRLDGFFAFAPCAGSTDGCAVELVCVELVCTGSDGGGTYGGGTGAGIGSGRLRASCAGAQRKHKRRNQHDPPNQIPELMLPQTVDPNPQGVRPQFTPPGSNRCGS